MHRKKEDGLMKKFQNILITTDLDGTLLRKDKSISEENLKAIEYFKSEGGIFTFITGRIPPGAKMVYEKIKPNAPFGCMNGGGVYDYVKGEMIWFLEIDHASFEVIKFVEKNFPDMGIKVAAKERTYCHKKNAYTERHRIEENLEEIMMHYEKVEEPIAKVLFADAPEKIDALSEALKKETFGEKFNLLRSDSIYFEVLPKNSDKGNLLVKIAQILGIDIKNTIAIGDNDNDVAMLRAAGTSYAVSNASPMAKEAATYITVSNEEHAIAKIIEELEKTL